jgi:hypothetical protein
MLRRSLLATFLIALNALFTGVGAAFAHDGHGLSGSHWHVSDSWGFVVLGALLGMALWLSRNDK